MSVSTVETLAVICNEDLEEFVEAVISSMKEGVLSLQNLFAILLVVDRNHMEQEHADIRKLILAAKEWLERSDKAATCKVEKVDKHCEELTMEKGRLQQEHGSKKTELANLKDQLTANTEILERHRNELQSAKSNLQSKQQIVNDIKARMQHDEAIRNTGIGLMFIPIIGTIIGATLIGVYQTDLNNATEAANTAEMALRTSEENVTTSLSRVEEYEQMVEKKREELNNIDACLRQIQNDIQDISSKISYMVTVQQDLRNATQMLNTLSGKAQVLVKQTEYVIILDVVINILQDISLKLCEILGMEKYHLLCQEDIATLISALREDNEKLKAISFQEDQETIVSLI
ncbi:coiled-coil domain-containing protein 186-like [Lepisosteus oculatus]|uniref:coiled-coil domain-containing protein 186-like n=1 Tax=Lepisosteus oculatus TaxID=7918 RepID=UPI0035F5149C